MSCSRQISAVKSIGNPNVSWSLKATEPFNIVDLFFLVRLISCSRILIPLAMVSKNLSSS